MEIEIITANDAIRRGITKSRLLSYGHGAFGEPDNTYETIVYIGNEISTLSLNDLVLVKSEESKSEVIQILNDWQCSDRLLEILNPSSLEKRKNKRYDEYLKLKKEIMSDDFYKSKI